MVQPRAWPCPYLCGMDVKMDQKASLIWPVKEFQSCTLCNSFLWLSRIQLFAEIKLQNHGMDWIIKCDYSFRLFPLYTLSVIIFTRIKQHSCPLQCSMNDLYTSHMFQGVLRISDSLHEMLLALYEL